MKRFFFILIPGLCYLISEPCHAALDTNNNGVSDFWEKQYNNGGLFSQTFDPQADPDKDGWSNELEAAAGTDPHNPNPPDGLIRPVITHVTAVMGEENGQPVIITPEAITVTWPSLSGKKYTLLFSPDLTEGSWFSVGAPFIASGGEESFHFEVNDTDKRFWRVAVEDVDSDSDGLTNYEELLFGTNPYLPMTFPGIPDAWLAENIPSAESFNPDSDVDGDGITHIREVKLGLNSEVANTIGLVNPEFSEEITDSPDLSFREEYPSDAYAHDSVLGWRADIGTHIEIWDEGEGNTYAELQSHFGAHGLKQEFDMLPGTRLDYILRYKGRYGYDGYDNAFKLEVEGADELRVNGTPASLVGNVRCHTFMEDDEWEKYDEWHYASISITAPPGATGLKEVTLSLVPQNTTEGGEEITYGGFVDLIPVAVEDDLFATGVDAVSKMADPSDIGYVDNFWIMAPSGNDPNNNPCSNAMKFKIPAKPPLELEVTYPEGAPAPATPTPGTVTLGPADAACSWHGESPTSTETPAVIWKIGAAGQTKTAVDLPIRALTMKRRTVRVALHEIRSVVPGKPTNGPDLMPTEAQVEEVLNRVFGQQINAWFDVIPLPAEPVAFDIAHANIIPYRSFAPGSAPVPGDGVLAFIAWSQPEVSIATAHRPAGYDIHMYVLGGASPFQEYSSGEDPGILSRAGILVGAANTLPGANYCIIDGDRTSNRITRDWDRTAEAVLHTIAHEVGHILVGAGHPDEEGGFQPLFGTARAQRLMCSGPKCSSTSLLLVKKEWDRAEAWMVQYPDRREQGQE